MPWATEDWSGLLDGDIPERELGCHGALNSVLHRIPGRERMSVAVVGRTDPIRVGFLEANYGTVSALPADGRRARRRRFDLILGAWPDASNGRLDDLLERCHRALGEGGILILTLPAASTMQSRIELRLNESGPGCEQEIHEVELQYRLQKSGYQGTRIRRILDPQDGSTLLAMAARRVAN